MKKRYLSLVVGAFSLGMLVGCTANAASTDGQPATYQDQTKNSIYGKISDFSKTSDEVVSGDTLTFKVTPNQYFFVDENNVTNNGVKCNFVSEDSETHAMVFSTKIQPGKNRIAAQYVVDTTVDFVDEFKLTLDEDIFDEVMSKQQSGEGQGDATDLDFRRCGIEQVRAPNTWVKEGNNYVKKPSGEVDSDYFINYVDGDTTHVETFNLNYTVKIRYLSIDTPESTSEIEEWGLTASYFSKFIYSGDTAYWDKIKFSFPNPNGTPAQNHLDAGASSLILVSKPMNINMDKATKEDLKLDSTETGPYEATTDGNQRNLAYVWYATKQNPSIEDFRCLNLEMVYQGFSSGIGNPADTSDYAYKMFNAANLSAKANGRHMYSTASKSDKNYYYYEDKPIQEKTLRQIYDSVNTKNDPDIRYLTDSDLANRKTIYKVKGYVSRKLATAFYIQDKPHYDDEAVVNNYDANGKILNPDIEPLGLYIFTYTENGIKVGDYVEVVGALSEYGGTLQMQGLVYKNADPDTKYNRNTTIISKYDAERIKTDEAYREEREIRPIKVTGEQFNKCKLPSVLVSIVDNVWFYDFQDKNGSIAEGGGHEINKYNTAYPFYNTSNAPIFWGSFGKTDNTADLAGETGSMRYDDRTIRFTVDQDIELSFIHQTTGVVEHENTYKFFVGGHFTYNVDATKATDESDPETYVYDFDRKSVRVDSQTGYGIIVISHGYQSTGNKRKMNAKICLAADVVLTNEAGA